MHPSHYCCSSNALKVRGSCSIIIARTRSHFCPYKSMVKYIRLRSSPDSSPLFLTPSNNPMSQNWFMQHLRKVLQQCNLPSHQFSGHSFRIGAATSAAMQGISSAFSPANGTLVFLGLRLLHSSRLPLHTGYSNSYSVSVHISGGGISIQWLLLQLCLLTAYTLVSLSAFPLHSIAVSHPFVRA